MSTGEASPSATTDALVERLLAAAIDTLEIGSVHIGGRLGFYRALAEGGSATSGELAARTSTAERYAREWLGAINRPQFVNLVADWLAAIPEVDARLRAQPPARVEQQEDQTMPHADEVVESMCQSYASAVNANDSVAYSKLFTADAIRIPPGSEPECGPDQIGQGEQADYDVARWSIRSRRLDALQLAEHWIYGIAHVDATTTAHADGVTSSFRATKTWLLQRQPSGEWLIARQMWNLKP